MVRFLACLQLIRPSPLITTVELNRVRRLITRTVWWRRSGAGVDRLAVVDGRFLRELDWLPAKKTFNPGVCFATCFSFFFVETVCCQPNASTDMHAASVCRLARVNAGGRCDRRLRLSRRRASALGGRNDCDLLHPELFPPKSD